MKRSLVLLLGLSLVVSLTGCHTLMQVGKFPEAPQVYGGIRTMKNSSGGQSHSALGIMGLLADKLANAANTIDFLPSLAMDTALLPLTIWAPLSRWAPDSSGSVEVVPQETPAPSTEEPLPE